MDIIMIFGAVVFFILFTFLMFIFVVWFASLFVKENFPDFQPTVSVIVPAYNEEQNIGECIDSVLASTYEKDVEIIVVDDGSTDNTQKIVLDKGATLIQQKHQGKTEALNTGVKASRHDIIFALDADTVIEKDCLQNIVKPLSDPHIGATTGVSVVKNRNSMLGIFQNIEYHYNNLIRSSFSRVFKNGIWFFGAIACYRKDVLAEVGYFKKDTLTEDMDIALEIKRAGYKTYNVKDAIGATVVPESMMAFYKQRSRWWMGVLQSLVKNKELFTHKSSPAVLFLFVNQFWWSAYALVSLPLIIYQVNFWLPYNTASASMLFGYLFRWFTLSGPVYVIYKIPEWGISLYGIFGVLSGLISAILIVASIYRFRDRLGVRNGAAIFFYFPYTIILNMVIFISLLHFKSIKTRFFLK